VEPHIIGARALPQEAPAYFQPGRETEAQTIATELAQAWRSHPGFGEWLREKRGARQG